MNIMGMHPPLPPPPYNLIRAFITSLLNRILLIAGVITIR